MNDRPSVEDFVSAIQRYANGGLGKNATELTGLDLYWVMAMAIRERLLSRMKDTNRRYQTQHAKRMYYLSIEYLIGRCMETNLLNTLCYNNFAQAAHQLGYELPDIAELEPDAGLGNGGLGRLAACYLDSLASLNMPGYGYGINYEYGLFRQEIDDGYQKERPDAWRAYGSPWLVERPEERLEIPIYGHIEHSADRKGEYNPMWMEWKVIMGVPSDFPIVGYGGDTVNCLRLYSARASEDFDINIFNSGDYLSAVESKMQSETISKVLYPSDSIDRGKELRLVQEYFFVACALRDILNRFDVEVGDLNQLPDYIAIHLNDTHPTLAIPEFMRLMIDERGLEWDDAWKITTEVFAYTNHTLMPEALEKWSVSLMEYVVPRHLQIIREIDRRHLEMLQKEYPGRQDLVSETGVIEQGSNPLVRMANLAIIGSHSVNGVAKIHSDLITSRLVPGFASIFPERFNNKTNGVTQRRWLLKANPGLSGLITETIGDNWILDLYQLKRLEDVVDERSWLDRFMEVKRENKLVLAKTLEDVCQLTIDPSALIDVHVKRIHEYKRQLLKALHVIHLYLQIVEDGIMPTVPRVVLVAGKAAPGYQVAKQIIKLINSIAHTVNNDPKVGQWLKFAFVPDYRVTLAEQIIPATDVSEQISTAGYEASGTSNMKFALNGALTVGTMDGANIEICEEVGRENIFIFGLTAQQVEDHQRSRSYHPWDLYNSDARIKRIVDCFQTDRFCKGRGAQFQWVYDYLLSLGDYYFNLADLSDYIDAQNAIEQLYTQPLQWSQKAALNVTRMGKFSSDRAITEYAEQIWHISESL